MNSLLKFLRLPPGEKYLFANAWCFCAAVKVALTMIPFDTVRRSVARMRVNAQPKASLPTIVRAMNAAGRRVPGARCLARSLAAQMLLARNGYRSELHIGVARKDEGGIQAHAWISCGGMTLLANDEQLAPFSIFPSFEQKGV